MKRNGYSKFVKYWGLDRNIIYLNHGSFGACPIPVLKKQLSLRKKLESELVRFFTREYEELYNNSKRVLADLVNCDYDDIVFVNNATTGVNTILKSYDFEPGDEILITNQIYPACKNAVHFIANKLSLTVNEIKIKLPIKNKFEIVNTIASSITPKTKLALIDHVSSIPGIIFPVKEITEILHSKNIDVLIDGAHAPGMIDLNIKEINPEFYTGNCHKWLCTPKGSAFLYVKKEYQHKIHPLVISRTTNNPSVNRYQLEFSWQGTDDVTSFLCIPKAIEFLNSLHNNGIKGLMKRNHDLVFEAGEMICEKFGIELPYPEDMTGSLYGIPFFEDKQINNYIINNRSKLQDILFYEYNIEVVITYWENPPKRILRIASQAYNTISQYEYLIKALKKILKDKKYENIV
ncbi:MAG: aminotransferase class V-fold PLP-dependent enzyme [Ignavibacteria bacterium]|nr:aminotransferase class V-fold PLP-dependent enzyme [Ignavibacteria bacterium]